MIYFSNETHILKSPQVSFCSAIHYILYTVFVGPRRGCAVAMGWLGMHLVQLLVRHHIEPSNSNNHDAIVQ